MSVSVARVARRRLPRDWPLWAGIVAVELLAVGTYLLAVGSVSAPRYLVYPFVWINVGVYAISRTSVPSAPVRRRALAAAGALAYALLLATVSGMIGLPLGEHLHTHGPSAGWFVSLSAPGWGPRVGYVAEPYHVYFVPYRAVGYAALAYLLYADLLSLSAVASAGALGLFACVGCAFPILASLVGGAGAATLAALGGYSLDLSTAAFLAATGLLWWPRRDAG
jgi:hypothetical protein